jgi:hypothetical protein
MAALTRHYFGRIDEILDTIFVMAISSEERRQRDRDRKRQRYAEDPEYRQKKQAANRAYAANNRSYDPKAAAEHHQRRHESDPEYRARRRAASLAWKRRHVAAINALITAAKATACTDCGVQYPAAAMDLDHVRGEKKFGLAKAARSNRSLDEVRAEIAKCDVRCAVCHRLRHAAP